jgi:hypothetical protein
MSEAAMIVPAVDAVEHVLREELAQGDLAIATARPILRHLLINDDNSLFSDEVIARIRGMMLDIARQLLEAQADAAGATDRLEFVAERQDQLAHALCEDSAFLSHAHSLSVEAQLLERLHTRSDIDPVLTPLVQESAASSDTAIASLAMAVLAAQARFLQYHRRMELPLRDVPGDLFHRALVVLRAHPGDQDTAAETAERRLREGFEEGTGRLGLLARLVVGLGERAERALALDHAGVSIFATALAVASRQERDLAVLSLSGRQFARLALSLRAAGLSQPEVEAQFAYLYPELMLPEGFDLLRAERAAAMLSPALPEAAF